MERRRPTTRGGEGFLVRAGRAVEDAGSTEDDRDGQLGVGWVFGSEERRVGELGQSFSKVNFGVEGERRTPLQGCIDELCSGQLSNRGSNLYKIRISPFTRHDLVRTSNCSNSISFTSSLQRKPTFSFPFCFSRPFHQLSFSTLFFGAEETLQGNGWRVKESDKKAGSTKKRSGSLLSLLPFRPPPLPRW